MSKGRGTASANTALTYSSACGLCGSGLNEFIKQGMVQNIKKKQFNV